MTELTAEGFDRRWDGLLAMGWSHREIVDGFSAKIGTTQSITGARAALAELYDEGHMQVRDLVAAELARRDGKIPPLAWDEDTIDDPDTKPVGVRKYRPTPAPTSMG